MARAVKPDISRTGTVAVPMADVVARARSPSTADVASSATRTRVVARKRAPGRPSGDPALRERLCDAALQCFARDGIAGTPLRTVAAQAGVTAALVHYYFAGKPALIEAVLGERLLPLLGTLRARIEGAGDDARSLVAAFVDGVHATVRANPWLPGLWVREVVTEGGTLRAPLMARIGPLIPRPLAERLAAAQRRGALNPDLEPRLLVVSLVGLTLFPLAAAPIWRGLFDAPDLDDARLRQHTLALLERGLALSSPRPISRRSAK